MSEPTERDILDYKGLLLTRKFNPFFWRNLYEETGGDEYWMHKDDKGRYTDGNRGKFIPADHPVLKEFADYKKKLGLEGENAVREIFKGRENLRRLGLVVVEGDDKDRFAQVFLDYDSLSQKSKKETQKPREQRMISSYLRNRYFNLGLEDPKYSSFSEETGKVEVPASKALKKYLDTRKELSDKLNKLGFDVTEEKNEEETYDEDLKELEKLQQLTETLLAETETETPAQIPAAAPAPAETPAIEPPKRLRGRTGITKGQVEVAIGAIEENTKPPDLDRQKSGEKRLQVLEGQVSPRPAGAGEEEKEETNPAINPSNTATDFAGQSTAPSDTMPETMPEQQTTPADTIDPIVDEGFVDDTLKTPRPDPNEPSFPAGMPPIEPLGGGLEGEKNKTPSVSMDITKDRINIGEKVDDIPTETILDKIPESRFSSQFKTIKQLNDDIKYFIKNFGNVVGKDLIKQYNEADKTNLELIRRLHGLIGGKLKTDNQKEKKVGIIIDADEYINQKINDALLNRGVSMNVPAGVRTNLESEEVKDDKSIGNFDVRKAREGGLLAVRREPVYRYIPSNNEAMNKPVDSRRQIKNGGLRMLPTQRRDLSITARKQVRDDPFARKHNPRKLICLY